MNFHKNWNRIAFGVMFVLISLVLLHIQESETIRMIICPNNRNYIMDDIYVPPVQYSHMYNLCTRASHWRNIENDNNTPGILPGATLGEDLGLSDNPVLSLETPIISPLTNHYFTTKHTITDKNCSTIDSVLGDSCNMCKA